MKKIITVLIFVLSFSSIYSQGKFHQRQNAYYTEAAAKEFNLNKKQKEELSVVRMDMVKTYMSTNKAFKSDEITKEEKKAKNREASKAFHIQLAKITGKSYKDMKEWLAKMREELKTVK